MLKNNFSYFIYLLLIVVIISCSLYADEHRLTRKEVNFLRGYTAFSGGSYSIQKDKNVLDSQAMNGEMNITLRFENKNSPFINKDSSGIAELLTPFVSGFLEVLDRRDSYQTIVINLIELESGAEFFHIPLKKKQFLFAIK